MDTKTEEHVSGGGYDLISPRDTGHVQGLQMVQTKLKGLLYSEHIVLVIQHLHSEDES